MKSVQSGSNVAPLSLFSQVFLTGSEHVGKNEGQPTGIK